MLCERCQEREANVHITQVAFGTCSTRDLCEECSEDQVGSVGLEPGYLSDKVFEFQSAGFRKMLEPILAMDARYDVAAYAFVLEAASFVTIMKHRFGSARGQDDISAGPLLDVLRIVARLRFAKEARRRLNEWGIQRCEDFGEIVSHLVSTGFLGKHLEEHKEYFQGGYDFGEAFPEQ